MATMSIRISDLTHRMIEEAASGEEQSVSEWVRQALEVQLGIRERDKPHVVTTLSKRDRHQLALLHEVLSESASSDTEAEHHRMSSRILREGFAAEYTNVLDVSDEMTVEECRLVIELLDMFRVLKMSLDMAEDGHLQELDDLDLRLLEFRGFDFNDRRESRMASYAKYLFDSGSWTEFHEHFNRNGGNSHAPLLASYLRMLKAYRKIQPEILERVMSRQAPLSLDDLRQIGLAARRVDR